MLLARERAGRSDMIWLTDEMIIYRTIYHTIYHTSGLSMCALVVFLSKVTAGKDVVVTLVPVQSSYGAENPPAAEPFTPCVR